MKTDEVSFVVLVADRLFFGESQLLLGGKGTPISPVEGH